MAYGAAATRAPSPDRSVYKRRRNVPSTRPRVPFAVVDLGLTGRSALVCGASQGIGLAIAQALAAEGANVAMLARRADVVEREAASIGALPVRCDLTVREEIENAVDTAVKAFGGLDIVVLNGGGPPPGRADVLDADAVEGAVRLLLTSHVHLVGRALPHLRRSVAGRIIAVESTTVREPLANLVLSNAIRPGVAGWLKTLATELGPEAITVNTILPGRIDTERLRDVYGDAGPTQAELDVIPLRRLGDPAELGAVACFLASDKASYVTGSLIPVDGGILRAI